MPYQRCYCTICRKTSGGGGFVINIEADATTLEVVGKEHCSVYKASVQNEGKTVTSNHERHFCSKCGSHLWAWNSNWPELLHPVAGAIDSDLPIPPENVHLMLEPASRANWAAVEGKPDDAHFQQYPEESLADWHKKRHLDCE